MKRAKWRRKKRMTSGIERSIAVDAGCSGEWHFHYDGRSQNFELGAALCWLCGGFNF